MKALLMLLMFVCYNSFAMYREYRIPEIPNTVNSLYLRDSLRYLALATKGERIINATYDGYAGISAKLLTFQDESIRVLILRDSTTNVQSVNIVALDNGRDMHEASFQSLHRGGLFTFPVNKFYLQKYINIREMIIKNIQKGVIKINTIGSASVYGTLLAIELSSLQFPIETMVMFGGVRFTTQEIHDKISKAFSTRLIAITHEDELSHKAQLQSQYAETLPNEYMICRTKDCGNDIFELQIFSLEEFLHHFSEVPYQHIEIYHDSLLQYNEAYSN